MAEGERRVTSFRFPVTLLERLRRAAELDRRSMTRAVEIAVEEYCERVEREAEEKARRGEAAAA